MKKRRLGETDLYVSELGLGCMSFPDDPKEVRDIVDAALYAGINFFDTADLYDGGRNEQLLGDALKGRRSEAIIATKVGNEMTPDGKTWSWNPTKSYIKKAVKGSIQRLGIDYIDLYQLHGGTMEDNVEETIEAFDELKREGVIRQYGISSIRPTVIHRFLNESAGVSVMMQYNMLDRRPELYFPMIEQFGRSVIARGTVAKGLLTEQFVQRLGRGQSFLDYDEKQLHDVIHRLHETENDLHAAAIHFNLYDPTVATTLIGSRTKEQLIDSVTAYETEIPRTVIEQLRTIAPKQQYAAHNVAWYDEP